ncbi:response regulator [Brevundimonas sp. NIBR11]|uniref:response regulator transcription factor n=1 Tax=Brevundimonas sp. NIBR11 TaxID=3015999 RepID=UPI0022F0F014|nr:response regulator [Brevundimonas sp. NIBR11]WGM31959.1 Transcriptional regulatory protein WalR [Brevundimonas sp. NIBR11]
MTSARILLIEDDAILRDAVDIILSQVGHQVTGVGSGEEGLAQIGRVDPHLVLLDVRLPRMSGVDTLRAVRKAGHKMPVLMLTADNSPATVRDVLADGGNGYILKPFEPEQLLRRVQATLAAA